MTPNEFVKQYMQNCQYRKELSLMAAAIAEENGLVVVFGASDDLCEIRGAEDDEIDCYEGGEATIAGAKVKINWCKNNIPWSYETDTPHEWFYVYDEDNELYCRGIVFSISDVRLSAADVAPVKHGHWVGYETKSYKNSENGIAKKYYRCSSCRNANAIRSNYCPNCGARMDEKE